MFHELIPRALIGIISVATPNGGCRFPHNFGAHMKVLFVIKVRFSPLLNGHIGPSNYVDY